MLYVVIPLRLPADDDAHLRGKIRALDVQFYGKEAPRVYFVSYDGTTTELAEALGYGDDKAVGSGVVIPITNYSGYASKNLWEWLSIHDDS